MTVPNQIPRRSLLQIMGLTAAGVAGAGGLAACAPAKPTGQGGSGTGSGGGEFHGGWPYKQPPEGVYNNFAPVKVLTDGPYGDLITMPSAYYQWKEKTYVNFLIDSGAYSSDQKTYTLKIKPGLKWSDGAALTAKDYVTTFWCNWIARSPAWAYLKDIAATDDSTFTLTLNQPSTVLERFILKTQILPSSVWGDLADRAQKLHASGKDMTSSAGNTLGQDLQTLAPKEYVSNGPFNIDYGSVANTQITLVKNPTGAMADMVKFDKLVIYNGETPEITPLVQSKDVDYATHGFPVASVKAFENVGFRILRPPVYSGPALLFNLAKVTEFADEKVRQALAYAIDRGQNGAVSLGESGKAVKFMAGFSDLQVPDWLSPGDQAKLTTYDYNQDKAAQMLEAAGWKKSGSSWQTPAGKAAEYEISFPAPFADWSASAQNVADQLTKFGIKVIPRGTDDKQAPIDIDKGNFQLAIQAWGASTHPHPYYSFLQDMYTHNIPVAANQGGKGIDFPLTQNTKGFGKVDLDSLVTAAGTGLNETQQKANVTKVAQVFNELLPIIPLFERYGNNPALEGVRVKSFPADSDPILFNAPYADNFVILYMLQGKITPV
ncbi:MAG: ABC transporter substrate-binding protein [Propionibacteriaceae bacterium]